MRCRWLTMIQTPRAFLAVKQTSKINREHIQPQAIRKIRDFSWFAHRNSVGVVLFYKINKNSGRSTG